MSSIKLKIWAGRYPLVGPILWIASLQYFVVQFLAAKAWDTPYSLSSNFISDLGNTVCGPFNGQAVCSPLHNLMNASFIVFGLTMAAGSGLIYQRLEKTVASLVGFSLMAAAGVGVVLVGLFPENTVGIIHMIGAAGPFVLGNLSLIVLSLALKLPPVWRGYTFLSGLVGLIALSLFLTSHYLGVGVGGMERLIDYPRPIWLILFGLYLLATSPNR